MTVAEALQTATVTLAAAGVDSPRVDAEWLLAHILDCPRAELALGHSKLLTDAQQVEWDLLIVQRGERIPLQHLLGTAVFCGLEMEVNGRVLVPRPETELLAEQAWGFASGLPAPVVLDFGTGSGCLAIVVAAHCPDARVMALDVSPSALAVARANAERHGVAGHIEFHEGDGREGLPGDEAFDLVLSNPPYIPTGDLPSLQTEVREHDPALALDGGADGLEFYRVLAKLVLPRLKPAGRLMLEVGDGQAEPVAALLAEAGWGECDLLPDLNNVLRMVIASPANP
ncbi:MAG: peptide chain release factor N(5)-glutamine methyltransferase [Verrucomicrobia subdivision 3 bacterium]|nr:peptide chain release factor N(5)-glutamine methyltransferase [Limisphaerales bacterium]